MFGLKRLRDSASSVALLSAVVCTPLAHAQEIEVITVTAQKMEQSIDEVPVAVSALSGAMVRDLGLHSSAAIASQIPNLDIEDNGLSMLFSMRGQRLQDFGDSNESPVGFYVDDIYKSTIAGQVNQIFDVARVEVLRGPQGTLYGRNTTAGLVHYISNRPTRSFEGYADVQIGSFNQRIVEAAISGPLSERVRARLSGKYNEDDGYQRNHAAGGKFGSTNAWALRGQVEMDLTDNLTSLTLASFSSQDSTPALYGFTGMLTSPDSFEQCAPADIRAGRCFNLAGFRDQNPGPKRVHSELTPDETRARMDIFTAVERLTWKVNENTELVSVTGYEELDKRVTLDEDASATGAFGIGLQFKDSYGADARQFSQEIRLSQQYGSTSWLVGAFYFDGTKDVTSTVEALEFPPGVPDTVASVGTESWAVFADVQPKLTDTVGLIAGVRYTSEEKDVTASTGGQSTYKKIDTSATTGRLGITWQPLDGLMTYASAATGFKAAEFNTTLLLGDIDSVSAADKEETLNYELGAKMTFWDGRANLRIAAFHTDIDNKQGIVLSPSVVPASRLINFGDATARGAEFELFTNPIDKLHVSLALGLLDSELDAPPDAVTYIGWGTGANAGMGDPLPLDGRPMSDSPEWTLNGLIQYGIDLPGGSELTLQSDFDWNGPRGDHPLNRQDSYAVVNFRVKWKDASRRYHAELFVDNAFDEEYWLGEIINGGADVRQVIWGRPRTYGARIGASF